MPKNEIKYKCPECLLEILFEIPPEYVNAKAKFLLENTHGTTPHTLIITVSEMYEVVSFEIASTKDEKSETSQITREVMTTFGLSEKEIELHFRCSGSGPVTIGEMALMANLSIEDVEKMIAKFVSIGLFKEITGAKKYFQALPPYPVIIHELKQFSNFIEEIKDSTPEHLQDSFKSFEAQTKGIQDLKNFVNYLKNMKDDVSNEMAGKREVLNKNLTNTITAQQETIIAINNLQKQSTTLLEAQFTNLDSRMNTSINLLDKKFSNVTQQLDQSVLLVENQMKSLKSQLDVIQTKISRNLSKLRLGIIQKTVEELIRQVISNEMEKINRTIQSQFVMQFRNLINILKSTFQTELSEPIQNVITETKSNFQDNFNKPFHLLINQVSDQIKNNSIQVAKVGEDLRTTFTSVTNQFNQTFDEAENRIVTTSDAVLNSFAELRTSFSDSVISTLDDVLGKIVHRLGKSQDTVNEFWSEARKSISLTMKDVWFVRSPEGMIAQIHDMIDGTKMRLLLVAPTIDDIDFKSLFKLPKHINIRISCDFNIENSIHKNLLKEIEDHPNFTIRLYDRANLWGINKDYEETLLGIVSQKFVGKKKLMEVAGIGTALPEHIKILVPVLEEAWMNSKKDLNADKDAGFKKVFAQPAPPSSQPISSSPNHFVPQYKPPIPAQVMAPITENIPNQTQNKVPIIEKEKNEIVPVKSTSIQIETQNQTNPSIPEKKSTSDESIQTSITKPVEPEKKAAIATLPQTIISTSPTIKRSDQIITKEPQVQTKTRSEPTTRKPDVKSEVRGLIFKIKQDLESAPPRQIAESLEFLRNYIFEKIGASVILNDIRNWGGNIKGISKMNDQIRSELKERLNVWEGKFS